jgi:hypothetical protein
VNYNHRCPKANRQRRRVINQAANAAVKAKGTILPSCTVGWCRAGACSGDRRHHSAAVSIDLEDPARRVRSEERGLPRGERDLHFSPNTQGADGSIAWFDGEARFLRGSPQILKESSRLSRQR